MSVRIRTCRPLVLLSFPPVLLALALMLPASASAFISTGDGAWVWQKPLPQGGGS